MRMTGWHVRLGVAGSVVGAVLVVALLRADPATEGARGGSASPVALRSAEPQRGKPELDPTTRRPLGTFRVRGGRTIRMSTAETVDGLGCLIEEGADGFASSCLEGGLFAQRRVEFMVSSMGGPERFDELRIVGVAAPSVGAVRLVKSDGTTTDLALGDRRAFAFESTTADLAAGVVPVALAVTGKNGRIVEKVEFPVGG